MLKREDEVIRLGAAIHRRVQDELGDSQREYYLREQLKAIQFELRTHENRLGEADEYALQIEAAKMPVSVRERAEAEVRRLRPYTVGFARSADRSQLSGGAGSGAVERAVRRSARRNAAAVDPRPQPFRLGRGERASARTPCRSPASSDGSRSGAVLCRPSRCWQNVDSQRDRRGNGS